MLLDSSVPAHSGPVRLDGWVGKCANNLAGDVVGVSRWVVSASANDQALSKSELLSQLRILPDMPSAGDGRALWERSASGWTAVSGMLWARILSWYLTDH